MCVRYSSVKPARPLRPADGLRQNTPCESPRTVAAMLAINRGTPAPASVVTTRTALHRQEVSSALRTATRGGLPFPGGWPGMRPQSCRSVSRKTWRTTPSRPTASPSSSHFDILETPSCGREPANMRALRLASHARRRGVCRFCCRRSPA